MIVSVQTNDKIYRIDIKSSIDISIPLDFGGVQPNAYGVENARAEACEAGALIGDTRRGGSCNFEQVTFIPHCNGTHTECVGHLTRERISIHDSLKDAFILATLVTVESENANQTDETYAVELDENDKFITRKTIEKALLDLGNPKSEGLIIRTLPNDASKRARNYTENPPPFFSTEAMNFIAAKNVEHLLADVPSIDRTFDEGKLANHRIFWNVAPGSFELNEASFSQKTITEMIFAPDFVADGVYLLNLQIAAFVSDAAPSRPLLFKIFE